MRISPTKQKRIASLFKRLESGSGGGKGGGHVSVAFRHRLAFTLLAITSGGQHGAGGGGGSSDDKVDEAIGDLIDILTDQQKAAASGNQGNENPSNAKPTSAAEDCGSVYTLYKAAVAAKKYAQANALLVSYQNCLKGQDDKGRKKRRLATLATPKRD